MTTELVWSTVKPTFQEVKGKRLRVLHIDDKLPFVWEFEAISQDRYDILFDHRFICYADLTAPVSPLPLWGKLPEIEKFDKYRMRIHAKFNDGDLNIEIWGWTEAELILAWNRIAEALKGVER